MKVEREVRARPGDHALLFYDSTEQLVTTVARFVADGLRADETSIIVAIPQHIVAFEDAMAASGIDVDTARADGRLVTLDAKQAMAPFCVGDWPQADLFEREVTELFRRCSESGRPIRVYGEMVALLWDAGQVGAAIELETLWNELGRRLPFSLLCAYPAAAVAGDEESFQRLCHCHSEVVGMESQSEPAHATRSFAGETGSLRIARQFVVDTLRQWDLEDLCDDASIVVSELATNAILHARSDFNVAIVRHDRSVRLSVFDASPVRPVMREPSPTTISGRGLRLVAALGSKWGSEAVDDGKEVWVELLATSP